MLMAAVQIHAKDVVVHLTDSRGEPMAYAEISTVFQFNNENCIYHADRNGYVTIPFTEAQNSQTIYLRGFSRRGGDAIGTAVWNGVADTLEIQGPELYSAVLIPATPEFLTLVAPPSIATKNFRITLFTDPDHTLVTSSQINAFFHYSDELKGLVSYIWECGIDTIYPYMRDPMDYPIRFKNQEFNSGAVIRDKDRNLYIIDLFKDISLVKMKLLDFEGQFIPEWECNNNIPTENICYFGCPKNSTQEFTITNNLTESFNYQLQISDETIKEANINLKDYFNRLRVVMHHEKNNLPAEWSCNNVTANGDTITFYPTEDVTNLKLSFNLSSYLPWTEIYRIRQNDQTYVYDLDKAYQVTHKVIDKDGKPLTNHSININNVYFGKTDSNGTFTFFTTEPSCIYLMHPTGYKGESVRVSSTDGQPVHMESVAQTIDNETILFMLKTDYTGLGYQGLEIVADYAVFEEIGNGLLKQISGVYYKNEIMRFGLPKSAFKNDKKYWIVFRNQEIYTYEGSYPQHTDIQIAPAIIPIQIPAEGTEYGDSVFIYNMLEDYRKITASYPESEIQDCELSLSLQGVPESYLAPEQVFTKGSVYMAPGNYLLKEINLYSNDSVRYDIDVKNPVLTVLNDTILDFSSFHPNTEMANLNLTIKNELGESISGISVTLDPENNSNYALCKVTDANGTVSFTNQKADTTIIAFSLGNSEQLITHQLVLSPGQNDEEIVVPDLFHANVQITIPDECNNLKLFNGIGQEMDTLSLKNALFYKNIYLAYTYTKRINNKDIIYLGELSCDREKEVTLNLDEQPYKHLQVNNNLDFYLFKDQYSIYTSHYDSLYITPGVYYGDYNYLRFEINIDDSLRETSDITEQKLIKINYVGSNLPFNHINVNGKDYSQYCDLKPGVYQYTTELNWENTVRGTLEIKDGAKEVNVALPELYDVKIQFIDSEGKALERQSYCQLHIVNKETGEVISYKDYIFNLHLYLTQGEYQIIPIDSYLKCKPIDILVDGTQNCWVITVEEGTFLGTMVSVSDAEGPVFGAMVAANDQDARITDENGEVYIGGLDILSEEIALNISAEGYEALSLKVATDEVYVTNHVDVILTKTTGIEEQTTEQNMSISICKDHLNVESNSQKPVRFALFDLQGRMISSGETAVGQSTYLGSLKHGVYIVRCQQGKQTVTLKFIRK